MIRIKNSARPPLFVLLSAAAAFASAAAAAAIACTVTAAAGILTGIAAAVSVKICNISYNFV